MEQTVSARVKKIDSSGDSVVDDAIAVEEPLEIQVSHVSAGRRVVRPVSITMRTPGEDGELALGFLCTEGILSGLEQVQEVRIASGASDCQPETNRICVVLKDDYAVDLGRLDRHFYTSSSCGVCGKASLEALSLDDATPFAGNLPKIVENVVHQLPARLRRQQETFEKTGGLHAAALFDSDGGLRVLREDVGRHNAVDKVAGAILQDPQLDPNQSVLLVSGRTSFEILQKAIRAGIPFVAAVGAPSSLAVEVASAFNVTLLGFLNDKRFNIYSGPQRVLSTSLGS